MTAAPDALTGWVTDLERRHLDTLRFAEVSRALRALSSAYVERRSRLNNGTALSGAGKRAAFALFYGPLHFLIVRSIVDGLPGATRGVTRVVDLGCGTGAGGAAWASGCRPAAQVVGIDRHPWTLSEAARTYATFGLAGQTVRAPLERGKWPKGRAAFLATFVMNELAAEARDAALTRLMARAALGDRVLIVEPIATFVAPWWPAWRTRVEAAGGRADEWRIRADLPPIVDKLDRAAGLRHRELTARSLYLGRATAAMPSRG